MNVLFIGDVFGKQGRKALNAFLPKIIKGKKIDFTIVNVENCTHGRSINKKHYKFLKTLGIDVFTFGNHTWENPEIYEILTNSDIVRPLNIKNNLREARIGKGSRIYKVKNIKIRVTNMLGLSANCKNMQTNPFLLMDEFLNEIKNEKTIHIIDFHTNATSEKNAYLLAYANKVSAIIGTHTHIQTADNKIYKKTAYITDAGMTGPSEGIIGAMPQTILDMYRQKVIHFKLDPDISKYQINGVIIKFDNKTLIPKKIERVNLIEGDKYNGK